MTLTPEIQNNLVEIVVFLAVALIGSEGIGMSKLKANSWVQLGWQIIKKIVNYNPSVKK